MERKPNLPPGADYLGNGPVSTVFLWHGKMFRFAQNRRGGIILVARPNIGGMLNRAYRKRYKRRMKQEAQRQRKEERRADDEYFKSGTRYPGQ